MSDFPKEKIRKIAGWVSDTDLDDIAKLWNESQPKPLTAEDVEEIVLNNKVGMSVKEAIAHMTVALNKRLGLGE